MSPRGIRRAASVALLVASLAPGTPGASEPAALTLETLMAGMASSRGVVAEFHETKEVALLRMPLESRGVLHFVPPDRLVRRVLEPAPQALVIAGERMWLEEAGDRAPTDLSADPAARHFVTNFVVLFAGDREALEERYETEFAAEPPAWSLRLVPRDPLVGRFVEAISLRGVGEAMREMVLLERDGDRTTTRFERVVSDHEHTPEELRALFGTSP